MPSKYDGYGRPMEGTVWQPPAPKPVPTETELMTALLDAAEVAQAEGDDLTVVTMNSVVGAARRLIAARDAAQAKVDEQGNDETDEEEAERLKQEEAEYAEQEYLDAQEDVRGLPYDPS